MCVFIGKTEYPVSDGVGCCKMGMISAITNRRLELNEGDYKSYN